MAYKADRLEGVQGPSLMAATQNTTFLIVSPEYKIGTVIGEYRFQIPMPVLPKRQKGERHVETELETETRREEKGVDGDQNTQVGEGGREEL